MNEVRVYTDGSASIKNKLGGAGVYIVDDNTEAFIQKGFSNTKTGRCEIHALLLALKVIQDKSLKIVVYSDSAYVVNTIEQKWYKRWEEESWIGRKNVDLWKLVLEEYRQYSDLRLVHIHGHQDDLTNIHVLGNSIADALASYKQFDEYEEDERI